ncbi:sulfotransferase domain-containing protein [Ruegeria atlantica]|uniref:Sulfotransferase domain protein n=1 Tax=Ruegeria atlantica TaxID=81569 RepID=A0A0P1E215_9RHOB|nr:sulfotransferase domain-containing protein [Ruegeria atlantica]CUH42203.1 Sulfotransferase domain protein [Ruegeria atlantica]
MSAVDKLRRRARRSFVYSLARSTQVHLRNLQDSSRAFPSFIVIGAHKAGTTSFYKNLTTHPQIWPAWTKEVHYFDQPKRRSLNWYTAHFPTERELADIGGITGEASPSYCLFPHLPKMIHQCLPKCKFIMLLRNPVDRAYSAHQYNVRGGMTDISFEDWIERDFTRLADRVIDRDLFSEFLSADRSLEDVPLALLRGVYVEQLNFWHAVVPKDQLLLLNSADYFADSAAVLRSVSTDFLNLDDHQFEYRKTRTEARSYSKVDEAAAQRLEEFYRPYNAKLTNYLGRDFGW